MGIEEEKIDQIIEAHTETVDALKEQRDIFKADAEKVAGLTEELNSLKTKGDDGYKEKYESEHTAFEAYKSQITEEKTNDTKRSVYRKLLKNAGISESALENIIKVTDLKGLELDGDSFKDADKLTESVKKDWSGFIVTENTSGANTPTPANTPAKTYTASDLKGMSAAEINANWSAIKNTLNNGGIK